MWVHEGLRVNPVESPHGATPGAVALGWESQGKGRKTSLRAVALRRSRSDLIKLLLSCISPAAPAAFSWGKAGLATGFLLLLYQAADPSYALTAVSKLFPTSCPVLFLQKRLFPSHKLAVKPLARLQSH